MARHKKRNTRRRSTAAQSRSFGRTLVWAFLLAIVFSIGLIAGQRMLDQEKMPPLVSISSVKQSDALAVQPEEGQQGDDKDEVEFSFYDRLGQVKPAAVKSLGESISGALKMQDAQALPARYTLQVGSHPTMEKARKQVARLNKQGIEAHVISGESSKTGSSKKVYRVRVGKFHSMDEARQFQGALKKQREVETFLMPL